MSSQALPWIDDDYRDKWRELAREVGIPDHVQNRDSRAGGITEAFAAEAAPDDVRKAGMHSQLTTTMGYSRDEAAAHARVMEKRVAARNGVAG